MAEALLRHMSGEKLNVRSAGVFAVNGSKASSQAVEVLKEKGIELDHKASSLTEDLISWATYIFTMTKSHKQLVCSQFSEAASKTYTLAEFVLDSHEDVIDPFGESLDVYRETRDDLSQKIEKLVKKLQLGE